MITQIKKLLLCLDFDCLRTIRHKKQFYTLIAVTLQLLHAKINIIPKFLIIKILRHEKFKKK